MKNPAFKNSLVCLLFLLAAHGCGGGENSVNSVSNSLTTARDSNNRLLVDGEDCFDLIGENEVILTWEMPTKNTDGSPLLDLAGFRVYYGNNSRGYQIMLEVGINTSPAIYNLGPGTWYFSATSFNMAGLESDFSNEVCGML